MKSFPIQADQVNIGLDQGQVPVLEEFGFLNLNTTLNTKTSTGILYGGEIVLGSISNTITILAGTGIIVDNFSSPQHPTYSLVSWNDIVNVSLDYLLTAEKTYIALSSTGSVIQSIESRTPYDFRTSIILGTVAHVGGNISAIRNDHFPTYDEGARLNDLAQAISQFNISGNIYGPNGANLLINKSAGKSYRVGANFHISRASPDITIDPIQLGVQFRYSYRDGLGGYIQTATTNQITPALYDDGTGTLAAVLNNQWSVQIIEFFTGANQHRIEYAQKVFFSLNDALSAIPVVTHQHNPLFTDEGIIRCYLAVRGGATNLSSSSDAFFIEASKFQGGGGTILPETGYSTQTFTATVGQTIFVTVFNLTLGTTYRSYTNVYVNGLKQIEGVDFNITGTNEITFVDGMEAGNTVEITSL